MNTSSTKTRALCVATRCTSVEQFVATFHRFCGDDETFFVATMTSRPIGLETPFSIQLADKQPVLRGLCIVLDAWETPENRYKRPGIRFGIKRLTADSQVIYDRLKAASRTPGTGEAASGPAPQPQLAAGSQPPGTMRRPATPPPLPPLLPPRTTPPAVPAIPREAAPPLAVVRVPPLGAATPTTAPRLPREPSNGSPPRGVTARPASSSAPPAPALPSVMPRIGDTKPGLPVTAKAALPSVVPVSTRPTLPGVAPAEAKPASPSAALAEAKLALPSVVPVSTKPTWPGVAPVETKPALPSAAPVEAKPAAPSAAPVAAKPASPSAALVAAKPASPSAAPGGGATGAAGRRRPACAGRAAERTRPGSRGGSRGGAARSSRADRRDAVPVRAPRRHHPAAAHRRRVQADRAGPAQAARPDHRRAVAERGADRRRVAGGDHRPPERAGGARPRGAELYPVREHQPDVRSAGRPPHAGLVAGAARQPAPGPERRVDRGLRRLHDLRGDREHLPPRRRRRGVGRRDGPRAALAVGAVAARSAAAAVTPTDGRPGAAVRNASEPDGARAGRHRVARGRAR